MFCNPCQKRSYLRVLFGCSSRKEKFLKCIFHFFFFQNFFVIMVKILVLPEFSIKILLVLQIASNQLAFLHIKLILQILFCLLLNGLAHDFVILPARFNFQILQVDDLFKILNLRVCNSRQFRNLKVSLLFDGFHMIVKCIVVRSKSSCIFFFNNLKEIVIAVSIVSMKKCPYFSRLVTLKGKPSDNLTQSKVCKAVSIW